MRNAPQSQMRIHVFERVAVPMEQRLFVSTSTQVYPSWDEPVAVYGTRPIELRRAPWARRTSRSGGARRTRGASWNWRRRRAPWDGGQRRCFWRGDGRHHASTSWTELAGLPPPQKGLGNSFRKKRGPSRQRVPDRGSRTVRRDSHVHRMRPQYVAIKAPRNGPCERACVNLWSVGSASAWCERPQK